MATRSAAPPSLTGTLRSFDDEALAELLRRRPDLAVPAPAHLGAVADRARTPLSVSRALDTVDELTLRVLDGLRLVAVEDDGGPVAAVDRLAEVTGDLAPVPGAIARLRALALVWGPDAALRFPASVAEATGPYPAGLGRPAGELSPEAGALVTDAAALRRTVLAAAPQSRAVLDRLAAGPPIGSVADAFATEPADTPVRWLISHHLLIPIDAETVELPREVGALLRRDSGPLGTLRREPAIEAAALNPEACDSSGAGQVSEAVRLTAGVLEAMAAEPLGEVKSGGLGMQGLQRIARDIELTVPQVALIIETAYAAGLLGRDGTDWLPCHAFDGWRTLPISGRWSRLATAWLNSTRDSRLAGSRSGRQRGPAVLSESLVSRGAPRLRREVLGLLAAQPPGTPVAPDAAVDILAWRHPRSRRDDAALAILAQASFLGITSRDAITGFGRLLIAEPREDPLGINAADVDPLIAALDDLLPPPVDELVVQSDLTVIVPGQPSTLLAAELSMVADKESATVHRVTEASLRRAMDAGYTAEDLRAVFAKRARTELPQTLSYLIDDVARRHGGLRAGRAEAYLRSQDETLVAQVLADSRLAGAKLRRLAPTVLISPLPLEDLLDALRSSGHSPVAEDSSGAVVIAKATAPRAPVVVRPERTTDPTPRIDGAPLAALVETVRAAPIPAAPAGGAGALAAAETLRDAVPDRALVWVEYVDGSGDQVRRLLRPVSMGSGYLRAEDKRTDMLHTIALSMIRSVTPVSV